MSVARRIVFAGSSDFAVPTLERLLASRHRLVGVLSQPDRPAGRGRKPRPVPVAALARRRRLELLQPVSLRDETAQAALARLEPDLLVVVAYGLLLPRSVLDMPRCGCLNVHASLLPRWRGAAPVQAAILAGDQESGVSLMRMDEGLDTGPVYAEARVLIGAQETAGELHDRLAELGAKLLIERLDAILDGALKPQPQAATGVTYAARISKADARIDWSQSAIQIDRAIRAYNPWPVAETLLDGVRLRCWAGVPLLDGKAEGEPGRVIAASADGVDVRTGGGVLRLTAVQLAGRQRLPAGDFANGYPLLGKWLGA